ncbi:MAG: DNA-binding protein HU-beta [Parcubacteria group bacterium Gr01-1014_33]|nr:MAG: DNA-binding protein HU-beta [Parcubacteria group bacterium Gr01-1014_33]
MNKIGIVDAVHAKMGGTRRAAEEGVDAVFETIINTLSKGEDVLISGFGVFLVKRRSARMGINPRTKEKIHIAETITPKFRAGKRLKDAVK